MNEFSQKRKENTIFE